MLTTEVKIIESGEEMRKYTVSRIIAFLCLLFYQLPIYCNVIWPGLIVAAGIYTTLPLVLISIAIEAMIFYRLLKNITIRKAFLMSLIGNAASTLVGTFLTALAAPLSHILFDLMFFKAIPGIVTVVGLIIEVVFMFLGSCLIELFTIKKIFGYSHDQLRTPVFVGNLLTYILAALAWIIYASIMGILSMNATA